MRESFDAGFRTCATAMVTAGFPGYRHALNMCDTTAPASRSAGGVEPPVTPPVEADDDKSGSSGVADAASSLGNPRFLLPQVIPKMSKVARRVLMFPRRPDGSCDPSRPWLVRVPVARRGCRAVRLCASRACCAVRLFQVRGGGPATNEFAATALSGSSLQELCAAIFHRTTIGASEA